MPIEAELKRRDESNALADWKLVDDAANTATGKSDPVIDPTDAFWAAYAEVLVEGAVAGEGD